MIKRLFEEEEDHYDDIVKEAIKELRGGVHLNYKESQRKFVDSLCGDQAKQPFNDCVEGMVNDYFRLLKLYSKGKQFTQFEQAWMNHINDYFVETDVCSTLWKNVLK